MRYLTVATAMIAASIVSTGIASAQPHKQRPRPVPTYMSVEGLQGAYSAGREAPHFSTPFGGPAARQQGSYYSSHPLGGGGGGSP